MFSFFCLKKSEREPQKSQKKDREIASCLPRKKSLLPVFGPSYVPILNENMAKSSPLSRNDQTFCCPFPFSGFQIVSSVSSSSSSLPRRARCSFNSFNAFISFFFWITSTRTQSDYFHYYPPRVLLWYYRITKSEIREEQNSLSLSLVSKNSNNTTLSSNVGAFVRFRRA